MGDDSGLSASQLRQKYHAGGSASDADLSAAQLRSRYGIASNKAGAHPSVFEETTLPRLREE